MGALLLVALDLLGGVLYIHPLVFQVIDAIFEILAAAGDLQHHEALFAGKDAGIEDVEHQIEFPGQVADQRFLDFRDGEPQFEYFRIHLSSPYDSLLLIPSHVI